MMKAPKKSVSLLPSTLLSNVNQEYNLKNVVKLQTIICISLGRISLTVLGLLWKCQGWQACMFQVGTQEAPLQCWPEWGKPIQWRVCSSNQELNSPHLWLQMMNRCPHPTAHNIQTHVPISKEGWLNMTSNIWRNQGRRVLIQHPRNVDTYFWVLCGLVWL